MSYKTGIGYDMHRLTVGRKLIIGGVEIPHEKGLQGHSDADVLLHAICDAILGALCLGDIGEHFPDNDQKYKDISSMVLLGKVNDLARFKGYVVENVDTVIQAEEPNLRKYKESMCCNIAEEMDLNRDQINVKATTLEGLGPIGNKEGIAAFATVLIKKIL